MSAPILLLLLLGSHVSDRARCAFEMAVYIYAFTLSQLSITSTGEVAGSTTTERPLF